ncbi:MAG: hypothetical protein HZA95_00905 [Candidatus Vogelbacteria bacterium]|nr:hypothetical protein [Candidatus Vogelbacteria bacterium]
MDVFYAANAIAAVFGFCLSVYILFLRRARLSDKSYICRTCKLTFPEKHARFLKIPLEYLAIIYYGFTSISYTILTVSSVPPTAEFVFVTYLVTIIAFCFSVYLAFIQIVTLRHWCGWCFIWAILSGILVVFIALNTTVDWYYFTEKYIDWIRFASVLGVMLGVGGATIADLLFLSFLRDFKISVKELENLKIVSEVVWLGLGLLIASSVMVYGTHSFLIRLYPMHQATLIFIEILFVNGLFLNLFAMPRLTGVALASKRGHNKKDIACARRFAYVLLTVSLVTWYSLFVIGFGVDFGTSLEQIFGLYFFVLILGITFSQFLYDRHKIPSLITKHAS